VIVVHRLDDVQAIVEHAADPSKQQDHEVHCAIILDLMDVTQWPQP
jgi:hypothetical protein